ncbi:MAG: FmdE family protein [Actinomycetota bacterium]|nr:FmdE family protein [Actinomycetota bacterium]
MPVIDRETLDAVVAFHGHMCAGLAMGIRAAEAALVHVGRHSTDQDVVAIVETDMCGVDAVQYLTGCTFGKGNLVHRDHGKNAYTFVRRSDGRAVRVSMRSGGWGPPDPEWEALAARVRSGPATPDDRRRFWEYQQRRADRVLAMPLEELYDVRPVDVEPPEVIRRHHSVDCAACGEPTAEIRLRRLGGRDLCQPCFGEALSGTGRPAAPTAEQ